MRLLTTAVSQPAKARKVSHASDLPSEPLRRHITISLRHSLPSTSAAPSAVGEFGTFEPMNHDSKSSESNARPESPPFDLSTAFSVSAIRRGVIKQQEKRVSSLFKNYEPGSVCSRLYVKNISKKATKSDLRRVFGAFVTEETLHSFDVCFMTKGKLHGQAFISFATDDQARSALRETNGYKLYEKPIVVMFARSAKK